MNQPILKAATFVLVAALALTGCDSPTSDGGGDTTRVAPRPLPADFSTLKAVAYSGYRGASNGTPSPTIAQIDQDLSLLAAQNFGLLRLFGSNTPLTRDLLNEIATNASFVGKFKVQLGIWISGSKAGFDAANRAEIDAGVALANQYPTIVETVSVGNETMVSWNVWYPTPAADMIDYLTEVRSRIGQPVTTDDNWAVFANEADGYPATLRLLSVLDYVSMHTYALGDSIHSGSPTDTAYWDWQQASVVEGPGRAVAMMDAALSKTKKDYDAVKANLQANGFTLPISIGETGWQSVPKDNDPDRAHPVNQAMYLDRLGAWKAEAGAPAQIVYFEAFDEPWKGSDDGWGLWDVNRAPKWVISRDNTYTAADAKYWIYVPPRAAVTKNKYLVYADAVAADATTDVPAAGAIHWYPWSGASATASSVETTSGASEGSKALEITPVPDTWGWGFFEDVNPPDDLSNFLAAGHLHFSIKTLYPGKLEVGFLTNGAEAVPKNMDVYKVIDLAALGNYNDGAWHDVSIAISAITPSAAPAYGASNAGAVLNMQKVRSPFTIADRYAKTGNTAGSTVKVMVDNIYWTKD